MKLQRMLNEKDGFQTRERVMDIYEQEESDGVIVSVGGQIPQNLAMPLHEAGVNILGTPAPMIDNVSIDVNVI